MIKALYKSKVTLLLSRVVFVIGLNASMRRSVQLADRCHTYRCVDQCQEQPTQIRISFTCTLAFSSIITFAVMNESII